MSTHLPNSTELAGADVATDAGQTSVSTTDSHSLDPSGSELARQTVPSKLLHELRTPLNQIIGYSEMLAEQAQEDRQLSLVSDLDKIGIAGRQLLAIINNRFDTSTMPTADGAAGMRSSGTQLTWHSTRNAVATDDRSSGERGLFLVVDDNEMNRDVLSQRLKRQGHEVVMAVSGLEALATMRKQAFDLVLLDIMMPEMDGFEVLEQLKSDMTQRHIPVIMISALNEMDSVVRCIEMGADDYLCKPFDPPLLKARIGACLEKKRARDREVGLYDQLQQNYKRLQELEKLRDDLMNMIVHDLRTPLTSVIAGLHSISTVGDLNADQHEMVGISISGGETLLGMINDLLDVDKLESGSMQLDYVVLSAADLVASAVRQVASLADNKNLTLVQQVSDGLPPLLGDDDKLRRVLENVLGNAIKFTPSGGRVTIEALQGSESLTILFIVSDTGEGIPHEAISRIFEKSGQGGTGQGGRTMSTGLGLAFCKLVAQAHGGRIDVVSTPGAGSRFSVTLPLAPPA